MSFVFSKKQVWRLQTGMKRSVRCCAVKASRGLKPLFPSCLAESQNNQNSVLLLLQDLEKWLEYTCSRPPVPGFLLSARSAALSLPPPLPQFHPCFISR